MTTKTTKPPSPYIGAIFTACCKVTIGDDQYSCPKCGEVVRKSEDSPAISYLKLAVDFVKLRKENQQLLERIKELESHLCDQIIYDLQKENEIFNRILSMLAARGEL